MEGDISGSNITPRIREVDTIALLCACIAKKNTLFSARGASLDRDGVWSCTKAMHPNTQGGKGKREALGKRRVREIALPKGEKGSRLWR